MAQQIGPDVEIYPIGVVSKLTGLPQRYLRALEDRGVLKPARSAKNRRLYSENEVRMLQDVYYMAVLRKVNIAGVKEILRMLDVLTPRERAKVRAIFSTELLDVQSGGQRPIEVLPVELEEGEEIGELTTPGIDEASEESPDSNHPNHQRGAPIGIQQSP